MLEVKFGVFLDLRNRYEEIERLAVEAERLSYDTVWIPDHLLGGGNFPKTTDEEGRLEVWTVLSSLVCRTTRVRLGPLVLCCLYRNPAVAAKMACTLDVLSAGRLEYGLGAGWRESECAAYGLPYPSAGERVEMLRETAMITKKMWIETPASYSGKHYKIEKLYCMPKPVQKPHPPILIAGTGHKILKVTAELGDKYNLFAGTPDIKDTMESLKKHCQGAGRSIEDIELTLTFGMTAISSERSNLRKQLESYYASSKEGVSWDEWLTELKNSGLVGTPDECVKRINEFKQLGFTHFILRFADFPSDEGLRVFASSVMDRAK